MKVAVQLRLLAGMAKLAAQGLGFQPAKTLPVAGVAVRATVAPAAYDPPPPTVPDPVPALATVRVYTVEVVQLAGKPATKADIRFGTR